MKNRSYQVGAFVVLLLLLGWWLAIGRHVPPMDTSAKTPLNSETEAASPGPTSQSIQSHATPVFAPSLESRFVDPKVSKMGAIVAAENSRSLDFYGRVLDQHGNPVAGVKVKAGVGLIIGFSHGGGNDYFTETDSSGRFSFLGIHGSGVGFLLTKDGYSYNQRQPASSRPNDYVPNPNDPVIFRIWKLKGAEPMIAYAISTQISCDGVPRSYDLLTGQMITVGGDFIIKLTRNPVNIDRRKPFYWSVSLEIPGGGLLDMNDLYPNEAPAEGYQPSVTIEMSPETKNWQAALTRSFYFKSGQNYGRITINIQADFQPPPTYFGADVYINPSGSHNLEFDATKQIR